jgi:inorganic triphosphatase YgiF
MELNLEREIKLSVGSAYTLPDLGTLAGVAVDDSGVEQIETTYWDGGRLELARNGVGLRHRRRSDRPGDVGVWTVKMDGHQDGDRLVRTEHVVPADASAPPAELLALLPAGIDASALHPVAVLRTARRVLTVREAGGEAAPAGGAAEVVDDQVEICTPEGSVVERFRELEVEVKGDGEAITDRVAARLRESGAGLPESTSKYRRALRALGHDL